ncbi:MAG: peptide chain release factor N(5)-glutamine methyltransferase [Bacteroidia bacterium]|nr:peptide chain release factor N(5)-glutamine methyltransferase [Bacteroidia bacterium]
MNSETVLSLLKKATEFFNERGVSEAKRSAEHLLAHALGQKRIQLYLRFDQPVGDEELELFRSFVRRRLANEPVQYIVGTTEFYGMEFELTPDVLIPRPETEHLVEAVVDWVRANAALDNPKLLDIGTGSGCIPIAIAAQLPSCTCTALDVSEAALDIARRNAMRHGVEDRINFLRHDMLNGALPDEQRFDIIVSNPPYVAEADIAELQPEIRLHEPMLAITDNGDGLTFYRRIAGGASTLLTPGGLLAVEVGYGQSEAVQRIFLSHNLSVQSIIQDYSGIARVLLAGRAE